jgi:hypothetical protein
MHRRDQRRLVPESRRPPEVTGASIEPRNA